jgi:glycosyltransferase involved in cell wall biosynthesis
LTVRVLVADLGRGYRGGQHQALLLLQGLRGGSHVPELIAVGDSLLAGRAREIGVRVHGVSPAWRRPAAARAIRHCVRGGKVDVLHANEPHALTASWLAGAHRAAPVVASRRIALPLSANPLSLARYRAAARIVAVSHFVEKSVIASGLPAENVEVIYDGVEIPEVVSEAAHVSSRARLAIPPNAVCLGNVAAFVPEKGQALLLHALANLRAMFPQCMALLAGEGPEEAALRELASRLGLSDAVRFARLASRLEDVYAATDIFVFPSREEPLGSSLLLAMAYGLPVLAIARGGVPEIVEHGRDGLLVEEADPAALAAEISHLLSNPQRSQRLGQLARQTAASRFSADHMVNATVQLYERIVAGNAAAAAQSS